MDKNRGVKLINLKKVIVGDGLGNRPLERSVVVDERRIRLPRANIVVHGIKNHPLRSIVAVDERRIHPPTSGIVGDELRIYTPENRNCDGRNENPSSKKRCCSE